MPEFERPFPPSLQPPPFWRTRYYENQVIHRADRNWIVPDEIVWALAHPARTQEQGDGRIRHWAYIPRLKAYIRIVTLADGQTVPQCVQRPGFQAMNDIFGYDPATDSLYIKLREELSVDNRTVGDDLVIDLGADGEPVGYDIQHASKHPDVIAEALQILQRGNQIAAE